MRLSLAARTTAFKSPNYKHLLSADPHDLSCTKQPHLHVLEDAEPRPLLHGHSNEADEVDVVKL